MRHTRRVCGLRRPSEHLAVVALIAYPLPGNRLSGLLATAIAAVASKLLLVLRADPPSWVRQIGRHCDFQQINVDFSSIIW